MTLKTKKFVFNFGIITSILVCIFFTIALFYKVVPVGLPVITLYTIIIITFISMLTLHILYKKTLSTEVILFTVFLTSLSMQGIRILPVVFNINSFIFYSFITRISIFFKYLALFSLLGSSLFSYSIKKQKVGSWILLSTLGAITISSVININSYFNYQRLLSPIIFQGQELTISTIGILLILINFIKASYDSKNREYLFLGIGSFLVILSFQLTFAPLTTPIYIVITGLLLTGSFLFIRSVHNISLWS